MSLDEIEFSHVACYVHVSINAFIIIIIILGFGLPVLFFFIIIIYFCFNKKLIYYQLAK